MSKKESNPAPGEDVKKPLAPQGPPGGKMRRHLIHNHPRLEKKLGLDADHVIVDKRAFKTLQRKEREEAEYEERESERIRCGKPQENNRTDGLVVRWQIEYGNDVGPNDGSFWEWWCVTNGDKLFECKNENDAIWLCNLLNNKARSNFESG